MPGKGIVIPPKRNILRATAVADSTNGEVRERLNRAIFFGSLSV